MLGQRKFLSTAGRLTVILVPLFVASFFWASYRYPSSADPGISATPAPPSTPSSMSQETAHIDASGSEGSSNAQSAIMFSIAPLTSLSPPVDPDPVTGFRDLIAVPPDTAREAPYIDPRRMRMMVDRGANKRLPKPMETGPEARA
jgi:hypothetical protein